MEESRSVGADAVGRLIETGRFWHRVHDLGAIPADPSPGSVEEELDWRPVISPGRWTSPSVSELRCALASEPLFARAFGELNEEDVTRWLGSLCRGTDERTTGMNGEHRGLALVLRFKAAYPTGIHHLAIASLWCSLSGELRIGLLHHESVPVGSSRSKGGASRGRVYTTFDTASCYPGDLPLPVATSLQLVGLPDVNLKRVQYPHAIEAAALYLGHPQAAHAYGATEAWTSGHQGKLEGFEEAPNMTCFAVVDKALEAMRTNALDLRQKDLPRSFFALCRDDVISTRWARFSSLQAGPGQVVPFMTMPSLERKTQVTMFLRAAQSWGEDDPWDVPSSRGLTSAILHLSAGDRPSLPGSALAVRFTSIPRGAQLDGQCIDLARVYPRADVERMTYEGGEDGADEARLELR